ncbi:MAG: hypothetical protein E7173_00415 [Firmicutes bacterium]|nr:hypothetical protein [Bacillota bacterium]
MMTTILDQNNNTRLVEVSEGSYLVSVQTIAKAAIDTVIQNDDLLMAVNPQANCTLEELTRIIELFGTHIYTTRPEINGILFKCDENELLTSIGFKPLSDDSEFLYQENNKRTNGEKRK